jgi:hypothetical protein
MDIIAVGRACLFNVKLHASSCELRAAPGPIGGTTAGCSAQDGLARVYVSTPPCELVGDALCIWYCLGRRAPYMCTSLQLYAEGSAPNVKPVTCYIPWRPPRLVMTYQTNQKTISF